MKSYIILPVLFISLSFFASGVYAVDNQAGWPKSVGGVAASPALADIDDDGYLEVVVGSKDGNAYAWNFDGTSVTGWPISTSYKVISSPAIGDIDSDGYPEVVVISTQIGVNVPKSTIYAYDRDGTFSWSTTINTGIASSPALGDLDEDGDLEIVVGAEDNYIYAYHHDGTAVTGFPKLTSGSIFNSPALADLDADGDLEIIIGSEDGNTYAYHHDSTLYWSYATGAVQHSSPAIGDIDGDGSLEIVVGSSNSLYSLNSDGSLAWSTGINYGASPALADIDGDGSLEIVIGTNDLGPNNKVHVLNGDGSEVWSNQLRQAGLVEYRETVISSPAVADLDGDGSLEIAVSTTVSNSNLESGRIYVWNSDGTLDWFENINGMSSDVVSSSPAVGDLDSDGDTELVVGSLDGSVYTWDLTGTYDPESVKWGMFRHDARHLGTLVLSNSLDVAQAKSDQPTYTKFDSATISAKVLDYYGAEITADSVTATVEYPDASTENLVLTESTRGSYSATFTGTWQSGQYTVTINAQKSGYGSATDTFTFTVFSLPFWHFVIPIDVDAGATDRVDAPIDLAINFTQKMGELGVADTFDITSPRVYETDASRNDQAEISSDFIELAGEIGTENIAVAKTTNVSSFWQAGYEGSKAVDNDLGTYWTGTGTNSDWLEVDLGADTYVAKVVVTGFDGTYNPRTFSIQVKPDGGSYSTVATVSGNTQQTTTHTFTPTSGRYVKMVVSENNAHEWTYIKEFEIYSVSGPSFDTSTNAAGNIKWVMSGTTLAGTTRYYNLYFDVTENGTKSDPAYGVDYSALSMPSGITVTPGTTEPRVETNDPPTANINSPSDGAVYNAGDSITFSSTGSSDADGAVVAYEWTSSIDGILNTTSSFSTSTLSVGIHTITLTVTDDDLETNTAQITLRINDPPTASISSPQANSVYCQNDAISFEGAGTDTDGTVASYSWSSDLDGALGSTNSFSASGFTIGTHTITLTVTDNDGGTGSATATIRINSPPTPTITSPSSGTTYSQENTTTFSGSGSDTDGTVTSYTWTSSIDGTLSTATSFSTSSLSVGTHTITLTVADNNCGTGTDSITVNQEEYDLEWLTTTSQNLGSTVPIKFRVTHPVTGDFVIDDSVTVEVYDPDNTRVFSAAYAPANTASSIDVRIDTITQQYITNFHTSRNGPTGTYTVKVEFASNRPGTDFSKTLDIHTVISRTIDDAKKGISRIPTQLLDLLPGFGDSEEETDDEEREEEELPEEKLNIIKEYDISWYMKEETYGPGDTVPIKFSIRSSRTRGFVIDESAIVKVYDPDGKGVYRATVGDGRRSGLRIDMEDEQYITNFKSLGDAKTGTYTVKVEFEDSDDEFKTTFDVHTRISKVIHSVVKFFKGIFGR